jgi:hypothetical protein
VKLPAGLASALMRETAVVLGGALLAALIVGQWPAAREWIARQWAPGDGCDCNR